MLIKKYKKDSFRNKIFNKLRFMHTTQNKVEERFYGNKKVRESIFDIIKRKRGTRFLKYPEHYRKFVDYNFKNIPENTDYCYGDKGVCPYYRFHAPSFMCHCDWTGLAELENDEGATKKGIIWYKTFKELDKIDTALSFFDQCKICGIGDDYLE